MKELILGSTSERRKEILGFFSYPFRQVSPDYDESQLAFTGDPKAYVMTLATEKARSLRPKFPTQIIVTADTDVFFNGNILGKPKDNDEAFSMLQGMSSRWHSVFTAVAVSTPEELFCDVEETKVLINTLTADNIHRYMKAHKLTDKSGSYTIQKSGSLVVKEIVGCYHNVIGLPINTLTKLLQQVNIDLWEYMKPF